MKNKEEKQQKEEKKSITLMHALSRRAIRRTKRTTKYVYVRIWVNIEKLIFLKDGSN